MTDLKPVKILLVEDSLIQAEVLRRKLVEKGYHADLAVNGAVALEMIRNQKPSLIISDVMMPVMDGYTLCREIKNDHRLRNIPVILLTDLSDPKDVLKGLNAGADSYLTKPLDDRAIFPRIEFLLSSPCHPNDKDNHSNLSLTYEGQSCEITSTPQQILNLLISTYENSVYQREDLAKARDHLAELNYELHAKLRELQESEERFSLLVQLLPDIVYRIDTEGRFTFVNDAVNLLGYESRELIGKHFSEIMLPTDVQRISRRSVLPNYRGKITGNQWAPKLFDERRTGERITRNLEVRLLPKDRREPIPALVRSVDNDTIIVEVSSSGVYSVIRKGLDQDEPEQPEAKRQRDTDLRYIGTVGIVRDITERKRAEIELRQSEERFRLLVKASGVVIILLTHDLLVQEWNHEAERLFEKTYEEVVGRYFLSCLTFDDDREMMVTGLNQILSGKEVINFETTLKKCEGEESVLLWNFSLMLDQTGKPLGIILVGRDVTEWKMAEEQKNRVKAEIEIARKSERIATETIDTMVDAVVLLNTEGEIIEMNESCKTALRWGNEKIGQSLFRYVDEKDALLLGEQVKTCLYTGSCVHNIECTIIADDGRKIPVLLNASLLKSIDQQIPKLVAVLRDITDRKEAESKLRESELRFRNIFEQGPLGIALVGLDYRFVATNSALCAMVGYSADELAKFTFVDITYPDDIDVGIEQAEKLARGEISSFKMEKRYITRSGQVIWVLLTLALISDAKGDALYYISMVENISERKIAETRLKYEREKFLMLCDSSPFGMMVVGTDGAFKYVNPKFTELFGYEIDDIPNGRHWFRLAFPDPDYRRKVISSWLDDSCLDLKLETVKQTFTVICKEGQEKIVRFTLTKLPNSDYLIFCRDITHQKRSEDVQKRLSRAIEQSDEMVLMLDKDRKIQYVNPAFTKIFPDIGLEVVGQYPLFLIGSDQDGQNSNGLQQALDSGHYWKGQIQTTSAKGSPHILDTSLSPVRETSGEIINYVIQGRDITQELKLQEWLRQSQKMESIGTLAGGIAHDFNNILMAIAGYTELVLDQTPSQNVTRSYLERVLEAAQRASDMTKQILTFSRRSGDMEKRPALLTPIIKEGIKFLRGSIPANIEIRQNIEPNLHQVICDPTQVHQVLMNFCTNAAYAMRDANGVLTVELANAHVDEDFAFANPPLVPGNYVRLTVSDMGPGIPDEIRNRIFEPFFTTKPVGEGTGLGLSVVHGIIENHDGVLTLYSESGKGATFNVFLPAIHEKSEPESILGSKSIPKGQEHVLVVEDEEILGNLIASILQSLGYKVTAKTDSVEALRLFKATPDSFDLVITDYSMPKMHGIELAREMLSIRPNIPVVLCSGAARTLDDEDVKKSGVRAILRKPVLKNDIALKIRDILGQQKRDDV